MLQIPLLIKYEDELFEVCWKLINWKAWNCEGHVIDKDIYNMAIGKGKFSVQGTYVFFTLVGIDLPVL